MKGILALLFIGALLGVGYRCGKETADAYYHRHPVVDYNPDGLPQSGSRGMRPVKEGYLIWGDWGKGEVVALPAPPAQPHITFDTFKPSINPQPAIVMVKADGEVYIQGIPAPKPKASKPQINGSYDPSKPVSLVQPKASNAWSDLPPIVGKVALPVQKHALSGCQIIDDHKIECYDGDKVVPCENSK